MVEQVRHFALMFCSECIEAVTEDQKLSVHVALEASSDGVDEILGLVDGLLDHGTDIVDGGVADVWQLPFPENSPLQELRYRFDPGEPPLGENDDRPLVNEGLAFQVRHDPV